MILTVLFDIVKGTVVELVCFPPRGAAVRAPGDAPTLATELGSSVSNVSLHW
jgi:hypothetical protein